MSESNKRKERPGGDRDRSGPKRSKVCEHSGCQWEMLFLRTQQKVSIEATLTCHFTLFQMRPVSSSASLFLNIGLCHLDERIAIHLPASICFDDVG
jgi:hypothetical protein